MYYNWLKTKQTLKKTQGEGQNGSSKSKIEYLCTQFSILDTKIGDSIMYNVS